MENKNYWSFVWQIQSPKGSNRREVLVPKGNHSVIENTMYPWHLHAECFFLFWIACVVSCEKETKDILFMMNKSHIIITGAWNVTDGNNRPIHKQHIITFDNVGPEETVYHGATGIIRSSFLMKVLLTFDKKWKIKSN